jgi:hypothetical protein
MIDAGVAHVNRLAAAASTRATIGQAVDFFEANAGFELKPMRSDKHI